MAQLEHERAVALAEQELLERLRAEELLFQQVRHGREGSGGPRTSGTSLGVHSLRDKNPSALVT